MPIHFTCPHCGAQTLVADRYAGQTGPCTKCGKSVTFPAIVGGPVPPQASRSMPIVMILAIAVGVLLVCGGVLAALLLPAVQLARERAGRAQCPNNLKQISLALLNYETSFGSYPPAYTADAAGKPLHSWRTLILPYMEQNALYGQLKLDEPWDSPNNSLLTGTVMAVFWCPSSGPNTTAETSYVVITGPKTVFGEKPTRTTDITDGCSNTILAVEVQGAGIKWAQPKDLTEEEFLQGFTNGTLKSSHPNGLNVVMCDGSVRFLNRSIPLDTLRQLVEKADRQPVEANF